MHQKSLPRRLVLLETAAFLLAAGGQAGLKLIYAATGGSFWAGILGQANGSVWEQVKITYFPFAFFSTAFYFISGISTRRYLCSKAAGGALIVFGLPAYLYACAGLTGRASRIAAWFGAAAFLALAFFLSYRLNLSSANKGKYAVPCGVFLLITLILFLTFTANALPVGFFLDPKTGNYGLQQKVVTMTFGTAYI